MVKFLVQSYDANGECLVGYKKLKSPLRQFVLQGHLQVGEVMLLNH